jgi:hypothetical protein
MAKENQPKGLMPFGFPQCEKVAALSLCSSFRENKQIQILRWRFDRKTPTRKAHASAQAKDFANCDAPRFNLLFSKNAFTSSPAARGGYTARDVE